MRKTATNAAVLLPKEGKIANRLGGMQEFQGGPGEVRSTLPKMFVEESLRKTKRRKGKEVPRDEKEKLKKTSNFFKPAMEGRKRSISQQDQLAGERARSMQRD